MAWPEGLVHAKHAGRGIAWAQSMRSQASQQRGLEMPGAQGMPAARPPRRMHVQLNRLWDLCALLLKGEKLRGQRRAGTASSQV